MSQYAMAALMGKRLRPQSLIFTLYGDYIAHRGSSIRVRSLIKLLALFDISAPAVRSTVSLMVRGGWLEKAREPGSASYTFTSRSGDLIEEGTSRILSYPVEPEDWEGCWHLVTYSIPESMREARDRFRLELSWLGYGMLGNAIWVSPYSRGARVRQVAVSLDLEPYTQMFSARLEGFARPAEIVARCWDLPAINREYTAFIEKYRALFADFDAALPSLECSQCFVIRVMLTHEYRRFPYLDPHLPAGLLPAGWRGQEARELFHKYHELLARGAGDYFDSVYE